MKTVGKEGSGGLKAVLYVVVFLVLTAAAIIIQLKLGGFQGPFSDNILIIVLINANFLLLAAVIIMTGRSLWKLYIERKRGVLGSRFKTKLVAAFVSLSFIPPIFLFLIASGMFTRSIERVFSLRIENSLNDSVSVAKAYYDQLRAQALYFGRQISGAISEERIMQRYDPPELKEFLTERAADYGLGAIEIFSSPSGRGAAAVTEQFPEKTFSSASSELVKKAFASEESAVVSDMGKKGETVRAVVPVYDRSEPGRVIAAVSVNYYVSENLAARTDEIRAGYAQYRSTFKQKEPIKLAYRLGFLAVTLTLLLAAIWVALRMASGITVPISKLAEGTKAVAAGDLDYRIEEKSGDEVGMLIDSFNVMTSDLKGSRERLEQEIAYKETILSNIDTGVVHMDRMGRITMINPSASRILGIQPKDVLGKMYDDAFSFIELDPVRSLFRRLAEGRGRAEDVIQLTVRGESMTLRMRVSTLRDGAGSLQGTVITFDDLTRLLRAQRAETWQGVARRIAHEFKNPLTPIKLSAERMRKKQAEGAEDFDRVFDECSRTIVQEADGLRRLVDEFANFARMPISEPQAQPITPVIEDVIRLYKGAHKDVEFVENIPQGGPDFVIDKEQIKRVFINLFENAVEAMKRKGRIWVTVQLNSSGTGRIEVADDGPGISAEDAPRLFEPDFSRKKRDGGLGLAIVDRIVTEHNGSIRAEANKPRGARFVIELPLAS